MKAIYLTIISIVFILLNLFIECKAGDNVVLKKLYYQNSLGEKGVTTFFYSEDLINYKAKWELIDGSKYSINYHFFDTNGNLIKKYREFSDSITSNVFYKYDEKGNLTEEYFERSDKVRGITWYYYENGRKIKAECRGLNGWFFGFIEYKYDKGILLKGIIFTEGKQTGFINYIRNEQGQIIKEYWDFGGWNQTFTYEYEQIEKKEAKSYTYSSPFIKESKNYIISKENYMWNDEDKGPSYYEYKKNKLIKKIYKFNTIETITRYKYNNQGLLMKSFRNYSDGSKAEFSYHYNENRQLVRRLFNGENGFFGSESYEYDKQGRLIKAIWDKFDGWISGTINFVYNENNELKSGYLSGAENAFNSDIFFETDISGNITKIHWEFSFGKTQTYFFKYREL